MYNFNIAHDKDYSKLITLNKLIKIYSKYDVYIQNLHIYNKYKYIKSCAYITVRSPMNIEQYFHYNNIYDLQSLYNIIDCILIPIPAKINGRNIFLLVYNYKLMQIVFIRNYHIFYTDLIFDNNVFINPDKICIPDWIYNLILRARNISLDIIDSKQILNDMR